MLSTTSKRRCYGLVAGLIFAAGAGAAQACDCLWRGPFVDSQKSADLIVSGKVLNHNGNALDMEVSRIFRGTEYRGDIRVWGDNGKLCRPSVYKFPVASEWVFALEKIKEIPEGGFDPNTPSLSFGRVDDYALSSCGVNWLEYKDDFVHGNVAAGDRWQYRDKKRAPVLMELLAGWLAGYVPLTTLELANREHSDSRQLLIDTRLELRKNEDRQSLLELLAEEGVELPPAPEPQKKPAQPQTGD